MIGTKYKSSPIRWNTQGVHLSLHVEQVCLGHFQASCHCIPLTSSFQYRCLFAVLLGTERMGSLGKLGIIDGISMRFFHTCNLGKRNGIKLIISDWCHLGLELVKADADVLVIQLLQVNRICGVVD